MCNALTVTKRKSAPLPERLCEQVAYCAILLTVYEQIIALWSYRVKALITVITVSQKCRIFAAKCGWPSCPESKKYCWWRD